MLVAGRANASADAHSARFSGRMHTQGESSGWLADAGFKVERQAFEGELQIALQPGPAYSSQPVGELRYNDVEPVRNDIANQGWRECE